MGLKARAGVLSARKVIMNMKIKTICMLLAMACCMQVQAKKVAFPGGKRYMYRVYLRDKAGCKYSLKHPEKFLSAKALARRARQHLTVDSTDLPLSARYVAALRKNGMQVVGGSRWNNTVLVASATTDVEVRLRALPFVTGVLKVFASPDSINTVTPYTMVKDTTPATPGNVYGMAREQIDQLGGVPLHEAGFRGQGMTIAIIDGGYMNYDKIPALKNVRIVGERDFVYPYRDRMSQLLSHGTMVLSCMAAVDSFRYVGTAPEAQYLLLRSEYGPTESLMEEDTWAQAAEYADSVGADVINSSLGYAQFDDATTSHRYVDLDGERTLISHTASMLARKGIVLVCSAGNSGRDPWKKITPPGDARDVLTVGAVDAKGLNTAFSSIGPSQDGRVKPDIMARGGQARIFNAAGANGTANGTSFASPIACGMVACLWQALPDKTAKEIISIVQQSADRYQTPDNIFGYGIPNFWKAYQNAR